MAHDVVLIPGDGIAPEIPQAMRPYMGGKEVIEPTKWEA